MTRHQYERNLLVLWGLVALALIYSYLLYFLPTLTGVRLLDGGIGVLLGLYICSHPAGNAVDMLFYGRGTLRRAISGWFGLGWVGWR